jgi:hypothetical protein
MQELGKLQNSITKLKNTMYAHDDYYNTDFDQWLKVAEICVTKQLIPDVDLNELDNICKGDVAYLTSDTDLWCFYCFWNQFYKNVC